MSENDEIVNLIHTLKDIKTILECGKNLAAKAVEILNHVEPKIKALEQRFDSLVLNDEMKNTGTWP